MALQGSSSQLLFSLLLLLFLNHTFAARPTFDIVTLGAKLENETDSSPALQRAWANACASTVPATIYVPNGTFYIQSGNFSGPCKNNDIAMLIEGTLVAYPDVPVRNNSGYWIVFSNLDGLSISGGILDGQGAGLWACKNKNGRAKCPAGATTLLFLNSQNIRLSGLSSVNSQLYHIVMHGCLNVRIEGVNITADGDSMNTDGIHVATSSNVTILNSIIGTGDDCISIAAGASNLWIENITCGPGHGISIGSLGKGPGLREPGVENVTVSRASFTETQNGVRIKSWGRPSDGFVKNVVFQHIVFHNVSNPVLIDQNYCPLKEGCPNDEASGVQIRDVTYLDIHGTSASKVAMKFDCSPEFPCTGLKLIDILITYNNSIAQKVCNHAQGMSMGLVQPSSCLLS